MNGAGFINLDYLEGKSICHFLDIACFRGVRVKKNKK
jgi:hypothetical protein